MESEFADLLLAVQHWDQQRQGLGDHDELRPVILELIGWVQACKASIDLLVAHEQRLVEKLGGKKNG